MILKSVKNTRFVGVLSTKKPRIFATRRYKALNCLNFIFKGDFHDLTALGLPHPPYGKYKNFVLIICHVLSHTVFDASLALGVKTIWGGILSTKRSARIHRDHDSNDIVSSMSYFVRHHRDSEQLFSQMRALHASGQLYEVSILAQCIIDEYNDNIQNVDFFILAAKVEIEIHGFTKNVDQLLRQALKLAPFNDVALAFFKMSTACVDLKDGLYEKGEAALRECLAINSLRPYAGFLLGHHLFWKTNQTEQAIALLEETDRKSVV